MVLLSEGREMRRGADTGWEVLEEPWESCDPVMRHFPVANLMVLLRERERSVIRSF